MALASAAVVLSAAAVVLMAMALQLSAAADTLLPTVAPVPIGLPDCNTTCGNVSVPYPFGFGASHCYWPGLNLTCDTSDNHQNPRLLLGDGSLRVTDIFLSNQTVRVMRTGAIINTTGDLTSRRWNASLEFGRGFREHGYLLSEKNELVVAGCNVMATISADIAGEETPKIVSGCSSFCPKSDHGGFFLTTIVLSCGGTSGCCRAPLTSSIVPSRAEARWLDSGNHTREQTIVPVIVFVAEQGQFQLDGFQVVPLLLDFGVKQGLPQLQRFTSLCPQDVERMVCKSEHSYCINTVQGYTCHCRPGFEGNGYIPGGCCNTLVLSYF